MENNELEILTRYIEKQINGGALTIELCDFIKDWTNNIGNGINEIFELQQAIKIINKTILDKNFDKENEIFSNVDEEIKWFFEDLRQQYPNDKKEICEFNKEYKITMKELREDGNKSFDNLMFTIYEDINKFVNEDNILKIVDANDVYVYSNPVIEAIFIKVRGITVIKKLNVNVMN